MLGSLPNLAPFGNSGGVGPLIPYTTGLQIDLNASNCGVTVDTATLATWPDKSGNGNDAAQATSGFRPQYRTNQINGLPAIKFDGSNDRVTNTGYAGIGTGEFTDFWVTSNSTPAASTVVGSMGSNTSNLGMMIGTTGSGKWVFSKPGTAIVTTTSPTIGTAWNVLRIQRTSGNVSLFVNGQPTSPTNVGVGTMNVGAGFQIGCDTATGEFWSGFVARRLFYSASLSDPNAHAIEDYLGLLTGITITH